MKVSAGTYPLIVNIAGFGIAEKTTDSVADIAIAPTIASLSESTGGDTGGTQLTIKGSSFTGDSAVTMTVKFGSDSATIVERNINYLVIRTPLVTISSGTTLAVKATVALNGQTVDSSSDFTFDKSRTTTIASVAPVSASPVLKGTITITGTNYGTTLADVSVFVT